METPLAEKPVKGLIHEVIPFTSGDGFLSNLIHIKSDIETLKGPVLLVHGAGVSANIFFAPVEKNFVEYLVEEGYDVWLENWRASISFLPNKWTLDQAALYDHPYAVKKIIRETGYASIKAVIHCQGSTSFIMSAIAGLVPQVSVIVSNAVSLHPVVPAFSRFKLEYMMPLVQRFTEYLNPQWGIDAPTLTAKLIRGLVNLTHHECDNPVCKQVSFSYGSGFPALWRHENLNEETHEWISREFAHVPMSFYNQIALSVKKGHLTGIEERISLPQSFISKPPATKARIAFFAGEKNLCFLPTSQVKSFEYFNRVRPDFHAIHLIEGYSHLDIFIGKNASLDVFPLMLAELNKDLN